MTDVTDADPSAPEDELLPVEGETTPAADAGAETVEGDEGDQPKPAKKTAQERIDELTRARRDAERDAEYWRAKATQPTQTEPKPADTPKAEEAPDPANYNYGEADTAYIKDLARYEVRQEFAAQAQQQAVRTQAQTIEQQWTDRQNEFAKTKPDYHAVIDRQWVCSPAMADAIKDSDAGPAIAYHLADNPDEARRINGMPVLAQIREIGRLEARLTPAAPPPKPKAHSDAPEPPPPLRTSRGTFASGPRDDQTAEEWLKARNAQLGR